MLAVACATPEPEPPLPEASSPYVGSVAISGLADLTKLGEVTVISGDLRIANTPLEVLQGLDHLREVSGSLILEENSQLTTIQGLKSLTRVGRDLIIESNQSLRSLEGLNSLSSVGGLRVAYNTDLTDLNALSSLSSVGWMLDISGNYSLKSIGGLAQVTTVPGPLFVDSNRNLASIEGLGAITHAGGVQISGMSELGDVEGLRGLETVGGELVLDDNDKLENAEALGKVKRVSRLQVTRNDALAKPGWLKTIEYNSLLVRQNDLFPDQQAEGGPSPMPATPPVLQGEPYPERWIEEARRRAGQNSCVGLIYADGCEKTRTGVVVVEITLDDQGRVGGLKAVSSTISVEPEICLGLSGKNAYYLDFSSAAAVDQCAPDELHLL